VNATNTGDDEPVTGRPPRPLWRNRDYMLLWSGQIISVLGGRATVIALPLLALMLTRSPAQAGFIGAVNTAPFLIFGLPAGAFVDRWNRKTVMIVCDAARCLTIASIPIALWLGHLSIVQIYAAAIIDGSVFVFFNVAEVAALPRVVTQEQLPAAVAQNQLAGFITVLLGAPLGGLLYQIARSLPFTADALSYGASVVSLLFIRTPFQQERKASTSKLRSEIAGGLIWIRNYHLFRFLVALLGGTSLTTAGLPLLLILLAREDRTPPVLIGVILSVAALGGVLGSFLAAPIYKRFEFSGTCIAATWVAAGLMPLYAVAPNPVVLSVITFPLFVAFAVSAVAQQSYRLPLIPDELQGRVNSVVRTVSWSAEAASVAIIGVLVQTMGSKITILIMFIALAVLAILVSGYKYASRSEVSHTIP